MPIGWKRAATACALLLAAAAAALGSGVAADEAPRVEVALFGEALCPYTARFVTQTLAPLLTLDKEFAAIVDLKYVAWGNAHNTSKGVQCQHGPNECALDRVINCATHHYPEQAKWLQFVTCLEAAPLQQMVEAVDDCAQQADMDASAVHECAEGEQGDELERAAAEETAGLCPPHAYVPWVLVNGVPLGESFDALKLFVCVAYTGKTKPAHCFDPPATAGAGSVLALPGRDGGMHPGAAA